MSLRECTYGKGRVRVMRVNRASARHEVSELNVKVMLEGDFEDGFLLNDNSKIVPTDSIKNVVHIVARDNPALESEDFAVAVAKYFLLRYAQVTAVTVTSQETKWSRLTVDGVEHDYAFRQDSNGQPKVRVSITPHKQKVTSGITNFLFLKSTGSGGEGFAIDDVTALKETFDRIFSTAMDASWRWNATPRSYAAANAAILEAMLKVFATAHGLSVQNTLFLMGKAALEAVPEISEVVMSCPNRHYLPINMVAFGRDNPNVVFTPTDEPHGQIECKVTRD